jgi:hypothetical protein
VIAEPLFTPSYQFTVRELEFETPQKGVGALGATPEVWQVHDWEAADEPAELEAVT